MHLPASLSTEDIHRLGSSLLARRRASFDTRHTFSSQAFLSTATGPMKVAKARASAIQFLCAESKAEADGETDFWCKHDNKHDGGECVQAVEQVGRQRSFFGRCGRWAEGRRVQLM